MDVLTRLDEVRAAANVLEHPFYRRWSEGALTAEELALYAGQYRHAVVALADASQAAAEASAGESSQAGLLRHAEEERAHVELWDGFAAACDAGSHAGSGADASAAPAGGAEALEGTSECVAGWRAGEDLLERLAVLYAIEASQPEISRTKLEGLRRYYGHVEEGPATEYFTLHERLDVEHAAAAAQLIRELIAQSEDPQGQAERMLVRARAALRGNWRLLDSVEDAAA